MNFYKNKSTTTTRLSDPRLPVINHPGHKHPRQNWMQGETTRYRKLRMIGIITIDKAEMFLLVSYV